MYVFHNVTASQNNTKVESKIDFAVFTENHNDEIIDSNSNNGSIKTSKSEFNCDLCSYSASRKANLERHVSKCHNKTEKTKSRTTLWIERNKILVDEKQKELFLNKLNKESDKNKINEEDLMKILSDSNTSNREIMKLIRNLRSKLGKDCFSTGIRD